MCVKNAWPGPSPAVPPAQPRDSRPSVEPVVECYLGALAQFGREAALPTQPFKPAGARVRNHEPLSADSVVFQGACVLQQEGPLTIPDPAPDPLDADEAGGAI